MEERAVEGWDEFEGNSPHKPWIDSVKINCSSCGEKLARVSDVGNPWLDAGIVSFSTLNYRHDKNYWKDWFPADWISESFPGQYRNWFYSLLTMSTVLADSEPCKNIFSYALMRDASGEEMHKSKGNAIWFEDAAEKMGVDAMRWQFASQNPASNLNFGFGSADEVRRQFLIPLWNVYSFFVTYANIDKFDPDTQSPDMLDRAELDRWILSELNILVQTVTDNLENFRPERVTREVEEFIEYLSNWYVRRSRRRFWKSGLLTGGAADSDIDKLSAYTTLHEVLMTLIKLMAPVIPFVTEKMYQNLASKFSFGRESVHLEEYPISDESLIDQGLTERVRLAMQLSSKGWSARSKAGILVRHTLQVLFVKTRNASELDMLGLIEDQILDELNIKEIKPVDDASEIVTFRLQPNLPLLGPKYGRGVAAIREALEQADVDSVRTAIESGSTVDIAGFELSPEDILVNADELEGYSTSTDGGYAVGISTEISDSLKDEGLARELVHSIQNVRRAAGLEISDRIDLFVNGSAEILRVVGNFNDYVLQETLASEVILGESLDDSYSESYELEGEQVTISVRKSD